MDEIYFLRITGVSHHQEALAETCVGEAVRFFHEPDNPYDCMAIRVENSGGRTIGYVPRTSWLRTAVHEQGRGVAGVVDSIGMSRACLLGVTISVTICADHVKVVSYFPDRAPPKPPKGGFRYWVSAGAQRDQHAA
ncbi:HIRAN domain-containing protein [Sphingobium yanoikuyae]|uniref:HIRAN domain-containing protein n=1 Tax=Sphingobium yanoikuyae TaxID=13690 RepID=UPI0024325B1C|nr:HIRAN domain-containing protein [Sphingobium yanoikuyae]